MNTAPEKKPKTAKQNEYAHNRAFRRKTAKFLRHEDERKLARQKQEVSQAKAAGVAKRKPENKYRKSRDLVAQRATKKRRAARKAKQARSK